MYKKYGKRCIDLVLSGIGLIVLAIPMLVIAIAIKLDSKGPAVFKQQRLGKNERVFTIYKFRTMIVNAYEIGGIATSSNDSRITKIGAILRRTSLDEIPQLINILKGEMSVIGPRPILPIEFEEYQENEYYAKRHDVRPGLFCTVDIDYRASADRDLQFAMDAEYVENITFLEDVRTFIKIIRTVVLGKNVYKNEVGK